MSPRLTAANVSVSTGLRFVSRSVSVAGRDGAAIAAATICLTDSDATTSVANEPVAISASTAQIRGDVRRSRLIRTAPSFTLTLEGSHTPGVGVGQVTSFALLVISTPRDTGLLGCGSKVPPSRRYCLIWVAES